ncbi:hypothetical protein TCAL_05747 [Tigriopus californicus]|uniref:EF-hand domain-containing protein n=2 Tax=Tigriopus californicus TaxID=6832 RepID=A0A553N897_TIGCA|nr:hypothetical protein TCAL_05747 [Tigriopus californicus]
MAAMHNPGESRISNLPTIVVVDSSKAPDEQKRTQITLYKPEFSKQIQSTGKKVAQRSQRVLRRLDSTKTKQSATATSSNGDLKYFAQYGEGGGVRGGGGGGGGGSNNNNNNSGSGGVVGTAIMAPSVKFKSSQTSSIASPVVISQGSNKVKPFESRKAASQRRRALKQGTTNKERSDSSKKRSPAKSDKKDIFIQIPVMESPSPQADEEPLGVEIDALEVEVILPEPETPDITITDTADNEIRRLPCPSSSDEEDSESRELERLKNQIRANLKPRDVKKDKEAAAAVVQAFKNQVNNRRPTKVENKWHIWKYAQYEKSRTPKKDWLDETLAGGSMDVGWGRRIYDKNEIESDDRERERIQLDEANTRHLNVKLKKIPEMYGLWDNIYDRRVIRALDCNAKWIPNRKEVEKRKKKDRNKSSRKDKTDKDQDGEDPFAESRKKWVPTGNELTEDDLEFCLHHTNYPKENIKKWFKGFRQTCPNGRLTKAHLHSLFKQIFPNGDSEIFCNHIFRIFDNDGNGFLDFKEFLMALDVASCRSDVEKLQWAFRLYDVDSSGSINLKEIATIMETMEQVEGHKDVSSLMVAKRATEIFGKLDDDNDGEITMQEFVDGYLRMRESDGASSSDNTSDKP